MVVYTIIPIGRGMQHLTMQQLLIGRTTFHNGQIEVYYQVDRFLSGLYGIWSSVKFPLTHSNATVVEWKEFFPAHKSITHSYIWSLTFLTIHIQFSVAGKFFAQISVNLHLFAICVKFCQVNTLNC